MAESGFVDKIFFGWLCFGNESGCRVDIFNNLKLKYLRLYLK